MQKSNTPSPIIDSDHQNAYCFGLAWDIFVDADTDVLKVDTQYQCAHCIVIGIGCQRWQNIQGFDLISSQI